MAHLFHLSTDAPSPAADSSLLNIFQQIPDLLHPFLTHLFFKKWLVKRMVSLSQSGINNTESKANRTGARFKWQCATIYSSVYNLCNPRGGKTANPADCEDSRTIRPNTCSAHLGRSITKQPAHRPQRAHVRHQSQAQKEAGGKPRLQTSPPMLAQPAYFNYHKQTQRLRQR